MPRRHRPLNVARSLAHPAGRKWEVALALLSDAARYAEEVGCNAWEVAVEVDALMEAGLTRNDLRWLRYVGHVSNAVETTSRSARMKRTFAQRDPVIFSPRTCFVATATGLELARTH